MHSLASQGVARTYLSSAMDAVMLSAGRDAREAGDVAPGGAGCRRMGRHRT